MRRTHAGFHGASLGIGCAVIQSPDPRKRDRRRAHRARLQRDVEIAIDQPLTADDIGSLPDRDNLGVRGGIAVGQGAVSGGGDDLAVKHDHASDRHFAGFSGVLGRFQRQIHERWCAHVSSLREKSATRRAFSKSGYRFCVTMRLERRARPLSLCQPIHINLICHFICTRNETIHAPR